ncbi:(2,3-dihydroxybenzoyl)adenylate synthase [Butyrivibrio sp. NC3005]|uniref:(2,3-dihydroxybenzoyl)adenylate synthase n=1 Tax=Butyrivibrio sp. NC3005 TaxID=1280685 RepID=UPI0003F4DFB1|nr:AMP-binding protein [Butyrivibrio sp. NC3005]
MKYGEAFKCFQSIEGWNKGTIGEEMLRWCDLYTDKTAVISSEENLSYSELGERILLASKGFINEGIRLGDRVILQLPNSINFIVSFFGLLRIGAIPIMALPAHRSSEILGMVKTANPTAYICQDFYAGFSYDDLIEDVRKKESVKYIITVPEGESILDNLDCKYEDYIPAPDNLDIAFLSLSGGTTGMSKLIPRTHGDYLYDSKVSVDRCLLTDEDRMLIVLPIAHNFVLGHPGFIGAFSVGATLVLNEYSDMNEALENIETYGVTFMSLVPSMAKLMLEILEEEDFDISSLRVLQIGGSFLEEEVAEKLMNLNSFTLQQVFGVAEGLNTMTSLTDEKDIVKMYQGKKCSSYDVIKIVDEDGIECPAGQSGNLLVSGPYTIRSYYNHPENDSFFTKDGFYITGDRAFVTKDGNLKIVGRVKEMINKGGEKILPSELETLLYEMDTVKDSAVVGIHDDNLGEKICVFIVGSKKTGLSEVRNYLSQKNIAAFKLPDMVVHIDKMPLTKIGKVDKKKLVQMGEESNGK